MKDMTVAKRLTLGFGLLIAMLLVISVISAWRLTQWGVALDLIGADRIPKIEKISDLSILIKQNAVIARNFILLTDEAAMAKDKLEFDKNRAQANEIFAYLDKKIANPKALEILKEVKAKRDAYRPYIDKVVQLGLANKNEEGTKELFADYAVEKDYLAAVEKLRDVQTELVHESVEDSDQMVSSTRTLVITLPTIAIIVAMLLAVVITRGLLKLLGGEPQVASELAQAVAQGDLTMTVDVRAGDSTSLMAHLKEMQASLIRVVGTVRSGSESVANASSEIASGNQDLSGRTEQQASALEQTAASMEEFSATVKQNAEHASQANQLASSASTVATQGGEVVAKVVDTMKGISDSSRRIADIIGVIDGIAFQTNILALNAAVEAARAGEQGRGFAVVASEVRSLASRSAEAAREIKTLINASVERVEHGTHLVDQAGNTMSEVVGSIRRVTDIVGEISTASREQSQGVGQIGEAVQNMDQVTQQNAALVEEMAAAASSLRSQAAELVQSVAMFKLPDGQSSVRAPSSLARVTPAPARRSPSPVARAPQQVAAPAKKPAAKPALSGAPTAVPAPAAAPRAAPKAADDEWETF